jgi:recombination protein RecR
MKNPSKYLDDLIDELSGLPGIGRKSASRLAFHILNMEEENARRLVRSIIELKENIVTCESCGGISDSSTCSLCLDDKRDRETVCVVENARDILTIESTGEYSGLYHVLMGVLSPLDGIGPEDLNIRSLLERCSGQSVREVILAFNSTVEGDATSLYISDLLKSTGVLVTRIAHGLPVGADLEYTDSATIIKSINGRVKI